MSKAIIRIPACYWLRCLDFDYNINFAHRKSNLEISPWKILISTTRGQMLEYKNGERCWKTIFFQIKNCSWNVREKASQEAWGWKFGPSWSECRNWWRGLLLLTQKCWWKIPTTFMTSSWIFREPSLFNPNKFSENLSSMCSKPSAFNSPSSGIVRGWIF